MTKAELVTKVAETLTEAAGEKVSKKMSRNVLDSVISVFTEELSSGHGLSIAGFGHFKVSERTYTVFPGAPAKKGEIGQKKDKSLATKVTRNNVSFRPAKALKTVLNPSVQ